MTAMIYTTPNVHKEIHYSKGWKKRGTSFERIIHHMLSLTMTLNLKNISQF